MRALPRQRLLCAALSAVFGTVLTIWTQVATAQPAGQASVRVFEIKVPAQTLATALNDLSRQTGIQVFAAGDIAAGVNSRAVAGSLTFEQALQEMLAGTELEATKTANGGFAIRRAAGPRDANTLSTVTVKADATATGPLNGFVAKRSATATKTDTPVLEIPQSISIIGREEMEARGAQDLQTIINYTPGVAVNMWGPDNRGFEWLMLRGFSSFGENVSFRDGLHQALYGNTVAITEPYGLERVEVLRGPSSIMFGQGDAGGVINRISKRPTGESIREIELQYGSFDRKQAAFDLGDRIAGRDDLSYRLVGVALDSNEQDRYPNGDELNHSRIYLAPSLRWQPSAATSVTFLGELLKNKSVDDLYYLKAADGSPTNVKGGDPSYNRMKQDQASIGYQLDHSFNEAWTFRQNFRYTDTSADKYRFRGALQANGRTYTRTARSWIDQVDQSALDTQFQGKLRAGATEHTVLFGVDWNRVKGSERFNQGPAPSLDILNPVYGLPIADPRTPVDDLTQTMNQIGLYAQDQIKINERLIVTFGGRQDRVKTTTDNNLNRTSVQQNDSVFSGRAGVSYLLGNGWAPYVSYAESFLPTTGVDAARQPFKPGRGKQVEAGVKFQPEGSRTLFTAALFDLRKTNVVTYDPVTFDGRQIGEQRSRGLELEAKTELMRGLNAIASYTLLDMKVLQSADRAEVGKTPIQVPEQTAAVWIDYAMDNGVGIGAGVRYVGKRWNDPANTSSEPAVTLVDAGIHYDRGPWRFSLNALNLLNKKYYASRANGNYYPGAERTVTATAKYRF